MSGELGSQFLLVGLGFASNEFYCLFELLLSKSDQLPAAFDFFFDLTNYLGIDHVVLFG